MLNSLYIFGCIVLQMELQIRAFNEDYYKQLVEVITRGSEIRSKIYCTN